MQFDKAQPWHIYPDDLTLVEHIHTGRFANIYIATWRETPAEQRDVVAKLVKGMPEIMGRT